MKPKVLLLHGSGTNPLIFQIQSRKLDALLSPHFELVYLTGFHECAAGPGVLPYFEGAEPYLKWLSDSEVSEEELHWTSGLDRLVNEFEAQGPFVGVIGFSQGAKAGMYLTRRLEQEGRAVSFFVSVCGTVPFQGIKDGEKGEKYKQSLEKGGIVKTESIHVIGTDDPWRVESEALVDFFAERTRRVVRCKGGHQMPVEDAVNKQLAAMMLAAYEGF
ncbi:serine hydrolase FSH [Cladorrhinum samala]|uniref:Serine hydrolase FSH n=1 Tax=Cladorrhinum samala TaxID=585594 RepID=A0AAV9HUJ6_9PEZI|nr:serine hydrolase FSH [Cladorrhinum samala]